MSSSLSKAVFAGDLGKVQELIEVSARHSLGESSEPTPPLSLACLLGHAEIAELLIKNGADIIGLDAKGRMPIHCAVGKGQREAATVVFDVSRPENVNG